MAKGSGKISELENVGEVTGGTMFEMVNQAGGESGLDNYSGTALQIEEYISREDGAVREEINRAVGAEEERAKAGEEALSRRQDVLARAIADEENRAKEAEGDIAALETVDKTSLVAAINTVKRGGNANAQEITKLQTRVSSLGEYADLRDGETLEAAKTYADGGLAGHDESGASHSDIRDILLGLTGLPAWDPDTHTLTFTARNNAELVIDLPFEALAKNIDYDPASKEIILIRHDGSEIRAGVSDLVDVYEGSLGTQVQVTIESGNVIKAHLIAGSVSEAELSSALVQKINGKFDSAHDADPEAHHDIRAKIAAVAGQLQTLYADLQNEIDARAEEIAAGLASQIPEGGQLGELLEALAGKLDLAGGTMAGPVGNLKIPSKTAAASGDGTLVATEAQVKAVADAKADKSNASKTAAGLCPALPNETATTKYLRQDGAWAVPPDNNTTYGVASASANGLMSAGDKSKLDGIAAGATKASPSGTVPKADGAAAAGTEANFARGDHVHPLSGAATANTCAVGGIIFYRLTSGTVTFSGTYRGIAAADSSASGAKGVSGSNLSFSYSSPDIYGAGTNKAQTIILMRTA